MKLQGQRVSINPLSGGEYSVVDTVSTIFSTALTNYEVNEQGRAIDDR